MNAEVDKDEKLRESACIGDLEQLKKLIEHEQVNINSQNSMNGWTALHWACKRNHVNVVKYLIDHGANKSIQNSNKELAAQLTNTAEIRHILEYSGASAESVPLAITPSYMKYPVFPYSNPAEPQPDTRYLSSSTASTTLTAARLGPTDPDELVLKARIAYSTERDFIEVEMDRDNLTFEGLVSLLTRELGVDRSLIHKVRKLPNTIVRKDKDVRRFADYQELEVVLTNRAMSASSRVYDGDFNDGLRHEQILY